MENHPRSGAKKKAKIKSKNCKTTPRIDQQIVKMVQENQFLSAQKASNLLKKELEIQVSLFTIQNQLRVDLKQEFHARNHSFQKLIKSEVSQLLRNM